MGINKLQTIIPNLPLLLVYEAGTQYQQVTDSASRSSNWKRGAKFIGDSNRDSKIGGLACLLLLACALAGQASMIVTPGQHINLTVQLPTDYSNESGVIFQQLEQATPQDNFTFSGHLAGYFDARNPARAVVWTTKAVPFTVTDGPEYHGPDAEIGHQMPSNCFKVPDRGYDCPGPMLPDEHGGEHWSPRFPIPCDPPHSGPSPVLTPEPGTLLLGFIGLALLLVRRRA